ncbi:MAG: alpha-L-fucosidase, partial [Oscillospiraceae bacterium]|nr:alpha-L-fucosidase [Oscillospiraceae bacterium]
MWYTNSYRRNLVDMHIADWNEEFLSEFSPDIYYANLAKGKIQSPMIYLQSHAGICNWPTKSGHMHNALVGREDLVKQLIDKCRAGGMDVVGYYSLVYNTWAEDAYPEWKLHDGSGTSHRDRGSRYGLCCPNNDEYRKFVFEQIAEIAEYFTLDGMFYDMLFWPEICRCDACKKRFGRDLPSEINWFDPNWLEFDRKRCEWMGEFAMIVTNETKRLMPHVSVEHNYASGVAGDWRSGATELVNEACDYTGGDLYGDLYNHSFTCKYYMNVTKNPPFEYMTCRCANNLLQHTITKTKEALELEVMLTCAHHGASFVIDAIDPKGTMDSRVYDRIGEVFAEQIPYEPYFVGEHIEDVGVFYSTMSRFNREGGSFTNKTCAITTVKTLIENHVPVGVCTDVGDYKFIFAPYVFNITDEMTEKFIAYVRNGGNLYFSGAGSEKLLNELVGLRFTGNLTKENRTYIAPAKEFEPLFGEFNSDFPLPLEYSLPIVEF